MVIFVRNDFFLSNRLKYDIIRRYVFYTSQATSSIKNDTVLLTYGICDMCKKMRAYFKFTQNIKLIIRLRKLDNRIPRDDLTHFNNIAMKYFPRQLYYISEYSLQLLFFSLFFRYLYIY